MNILGLNCAHDGSACIVSNGKLVAALAHERIYRNPAGKREKKAHGVSEALIDYVLETAGIEFDKVDAVTLSNYSEGFVQGVLFATDNGERFTRNSWDVVWGNDVLDLDVHLRGKILPGYAPSHHITHCAAAYYTSPFDKASCMSMDASGGKVASNGMIATGEGNRLTALNGPTCLIGVAYGQFCERLGLGPQIYKAGSLMGLAGYGKVLSHVEKNVKRIVEDSFFEEGEDYRRWVGEIASKHATSRRLSSSSSSNAPSNGPRNCLTTSALVVGRS